MKYFESTTNWMLQCINTYEKQKKKIVNDKESNKFAKQYDITPK